MAQDEFMKLFKYMQEMRSEMNEHFEEATKDRADIRGAIAELSADIKSYHEELLALGHKVDRLERWVRQIADETGVKLSFD